MNLGDSTTLSELWYRTSVIFRRHVRNHLEFDVGSRMEIAFLEAGITPRLDTWGPIDACSVTKRGHADMGRQRTEATGGKGSRWVLPGAVGQVQGRSRRRAVPLLGPRPVDLTRRPPAQGLAELEHERDPPGHEDEGQGDVGHEQKRSWTGSLSAVRPRLPPPPHPPQKKTQTGTTSRRGTHRALRSRWLPGC